METKTKRDVENKTEAAILHLRQARRLLDVVHRSYADSAPLTASEQAEWRKVIDLVAPLDAMHESGALDR